MNAPETLQEKHRLPPPLMFFGLALLIGILSAFCPACAIVLASSLIGFLLLYRFVTTHLSVLVLALVLGLPLHALGMKILETRFGVGGVRILVIGMWKDALLLILLVASFVAKNKRQQGFPQLRLFELLMLIYACYCALYVLVSPSLLQASYGFRGNVEPLLFYFLFRNLAPSYSQLRRLTIWVLGLGALLAVFAAFQAHFWSFSTYQSLGYALITGQLPSTFTIVGAGWARPTSTFSSPNTAGLYFALLGVLAAGLLQTEDRRNSRLKLLIVLAIISIGLLYTMSRSGLVLIVLGLLTLTLLGPRMARRTRERLSRAVLTLAVLGVVAFGTMSSQFTSSMIDRLTRTLSGTDPSASGRIPDMLNAFAIIREHPLGVGLGLVGARTGKLNDDYWMQYHTENYFLQITMEIGILGGVLLLAIYVGAGIALWRRRSRLQVHKAIISPSIALGCLIGTLAANMFIPQLNELVLAGYLWMFVAIALGLKTSNPYRCITVLSVGHLRDDLFDGEQGLRCQA